MKLFSGFNFETAGRGNNVGTHTWLTPPHILRALGHFDLDPCAAPEPRPWNTADTMYDFSKGQNGLRLPWFGRVLCNPPYGLTTKEWMRRSAEHGSGVSLMFARPDTRCWREVVFPRAKAILWLDGRLHFYKPDGTEGGSAGSPSVLLAWSDYDAQVLENCGLRGHMTYGAVRTATAQREFTWRKAA